MTQAEGIQIVASFFGSLGFSVLYNIHGRRLWYAAFGGMLAWAFYVLLGRWMPSDMVRYFFVGILVMFYAEVLARLVKTPTTSFLVPVLIPLVPGGALYRTMHYAMYGDRAQFFYWGTYALGLAAALAAGLLVASSVNKILYTTREHRAKP